MTELAPIRRQTVTEASTDDELIRTWLRTGRRRSEQTRQAYRRDVRRFLDYVRRPLREVTLDALADYQEHLAESDYAVSTQRRMLSSVRSLLSFAQKTGYTAVNVGAAINLPEGEDTLSERILSEDEVQRMIQREDNRRNRLLLRLLYATGARVSELCRLEWRNVQEREHSGQVTIHGKGDKTRSVLVPVATWRELTALYDGEGPDDPVFQSRQGGALSRVQVYRIVKAAAKRAGIDKDVSPHWLRHSHVTHALERGAPVGLVQKTVGHSDMSITGRYFHARPDDSSGMYLSV